jgi:protein involved in polysaccharide export with SLBB domain
MKCFLLVLTILCLLNSCGIFRKTANMVTSIPMPSLSGMKKIIPKLSADDSVGGDDPFQAFDPRRPLTYGDTLRVRVYQGVRELEEIYADLAMVEQDGTAKFDELGSARLGGRNLMEARSMIEAVMRGAGHSASRLHVHIISVENMPLITVEGNVKFPAVYHYRDGVRVSEMIQLAGGKGAASYSRAVYVTHRGQRRFYTTDAAADGFRLEPGDVISLPSDL